MLVTARARLLWKRYKAVDTLWAHSVETHAEENAAGRLDVELRLHFHGLEDGLVVWPSNKRLQEHRETGGSSFTQWCWTTQWEYPMRTERYGDQGPRSGRVSQKVSSESADQVVVNYRTGAGPATAPKQSTTQQCWSDDRQPRRCKLPQDGAGGGDQTRSRTRKSDATRTMTTRKSQSGDKKPTSVGDTHEPKPRIGTKEEVCNSCLERETARRLAERGSDGREGQRKTARVGAQESVKEEQCQPQANTLIRNGSEKIGVRRRGDSSCPRSTDKNSRAISERAGRDAHRS